MMEKAAGFRPDAYIPDMEDSVAIADKADARRTVREHAAALGAAGIPVIPRVNARDSGFAVDDLRSVVCPDIRGISIGKVNTAEDVLWICDVLSGLEREAGMTAGGLELILWIETALGIVNCYDICRASRRISAVAFGAEDYTHDMGIERLADESNVLYPRSMLCVAARAAGVQALDTPYFEFRNEQGLLENATASKTIGFKGKFAIHPAQVDPISRVFSPSGEEIDQAKRIVAAFEEAERDGRGSTSLDGRVIDVPVYKRARALLFH
jgi:citrate lyase subunit beta/citryl-CoA lyase